MAHQGWVRRARRALLLLLAWGLLMIGSLQLRHSGQANLVVLQESGEASAAAAAAAAAGGGAGAGASGRGSLAASRFLLERQAPATAATPATAPASPGPEAAEPLVDRRPARTEEELVREIEERLPSLPLAYWARNSRLGPANGGGGAAGGSRTGSECVPRYPSIFELEFNNVYWQTVRTSNGTFQLFGAYYDNRRHSRIGPAVRVVAMIDRIEPKLRTFCHLWFEGERVPRIVEVLEYKYIWYRKWGNYRQGIYQPYVIACQVPQSHWARGPPASVSIVEHRCDTASANLRVTYNKPLGPKQGFAVCVKGLDFLHEDLSVRLVEWIELLGLLGADKIFFYELQVHPNVTKVLEHYQRLGRVHVTPLTLPGGQPNVPAFQHMYLTKKTNHKRQNELIPYNDCLYKHMYEFEYIALLDVDEVIMPVQDATWPELMRRVLPKALKLKNETRASYNVRNVYFLDDLLDGHGPFKDIPRYMHMLQHVYRSRNFTKPNQYIKCFHNPERVVTLHNHFPLACLGADCTSYPIDTKDAQLQHYRADCVKSLKKTCVEYRENSLLDTTIWRYKDKLVSRVTETLKFLGFFGGAATAGAAAASAAAS